MSLEIVDASSDLETVLRTPDTELSDIVAETPSGHPLFVKVDADTGVTWVLVGRDTNHARELAELATAFVGPSFAVIRRRTDRGQLPPLARELGDHAVTVQPASQAQSDTEARLLSLARLLRHRPVRRGAVARTLGTVISDLRVAMAERDREGGEQLLAELAQRKDITRTNLAFARIQLLSRVGAHDEVLAFPGLNRITGSVRPRDVTQALLESCAAVYLEGVAYEDRESWATQGTHVRRLLGPVAETVIPPRSVAEVRALVAAELALQERDLDRLAPLIEYLRQAGEPVDPLVELLGGPRESELTAEPPHEPEAPRDIAASVLALMNRRRFGDALEALQGAAPQVDLAWAAYNIHRELGTDASQRVFVRMAEPLRSELEHEAENVQLLQALEEIGLGHEVVEDPADWYEWLERARAGVSSQNLVALLERGAAGWPATAESAAELADFVRDDVELLLRPAYGRVLERHDDVLDSPAGLALLMEVAEMVVVAGPSSQELASLPGWVETLVATDHREETAQRIVDVLRATMVERPPPVVVNCVADLTGILASHPLSAIDVLQVAEEVAEWMRQYGEVADESARLSLAHALGDLGAPRAGGDPFWFPPSQGNVMARLRGKRIGIYTLMVSVAARIKKVLRPPRGEGDVQVNSDKVATKALVSLAESADMMFVVTGAAKHAATDAIKQARGGRPIVQIHRKGFTALYEAVKDWAEEQGGSD